MIREGCPGIHTPCPPPPPRDKGRGRQQGEERDTSQSPTGSRDTPSACDNPSLVLTYTLHLGAPPLSWDIHPSPLTPTSSRKAALTMPAPGASLL